MQKSKKKAKTTFGISFEEIQRIAEEFRRTFVAILNGIRRLINRIFGTNLVMIADGASFDQHPEKTQSEQQKIAREAKKVAEAPSPAMSRGGQVERLHAQYDAERNAEMQKLLTLKNLNYPGPAVFPPKERRAFGEDYYLYARYEYGARNHMGSLAVFERWGDVPKGVRDYIHSLTYGQLRTICSCRFNEFRDHLSGRRPMHGIPLPPDVQVQPDRRPPRPEPERKRSADEERHREKWRMIAMRANEIDGRSDRNLRQDRSDRSIH